MTMGGMQGLSGFDGTKLSPVVLRFVTADLRPQPVSKELGALIGSIQGHGFRWSMGRTCDVLS